jgi:transcription initiation factor TFIIIB Brf1 subunit/transcription initiation factor TFIIB
MKIKFFSVVLIAVSCLFSSFKPQETGQVYFLRSTNSIGSMVAYKIYIDDELVCHLKNKRYSMHNVPAGEHTVSIQNTGLASHAKSRPLKITVLPDKSNYLVVVNGSELYLQETVESSAQELLKRVAATTKCLPSDKKK